MKTLIIINAVVNFLIIAKWLWDNNRLHLSYDRTFWHKRLVSVTIMWVDRPRYLVKQGGGWAASGLFTIQFRHREKASEKDSKDYHAKAKQRNA